MNLLIPTVSQECSIISPVKDSLVWSFVSLDNGRVADLKIYKNYKEIDKPIDYIIIKDQNEDVEEFLDEGIDILVASFQKEVDDIVEAFIFRELFDYNG